MELLNESFYVSVVVHLALIAKRIQVIHPKISSKLRNIQSICQSIED